MPILRNERTYPLTLKGSAQHAINAGVTAAYDFAGDPNNSYAGGNGARHAGTHNYTAPANTPTIVTVSPSILGRDPSVGKTVITTYSGMDLLKYGIGTSDGKGNFTIHRRMRVPSAIQTASATTWTIGVYRDASGTKLSLLMTENVAGYFFFRVEAGAVQIPSISAASGSTTIRRSPGSVVDIHIERDGDTLNYYLDGVLAFSGAVPALTTFNTAWAGSAAPNGIYVAPAQDLVLIDETYWNRAIGSTGVSQHRADPYASYQNTAAVPDGVTIGNPLAGSTVNSEGFSIGGTYAGATVPTGIQYRFDGGAWVTLTGATIGGGVYSGTTAGVTATTSLLEVRMANATSITASVGNITAKPPIPTVAITSQPVPNGQSQQFILAITRANKVAVTLTANGSGAVTQGPTEFVVSGATADVTMTAIVAGDYTGSILATGDGGTATTSITPFSILGIGGGGTPGEQPGVSTVASVTVSPSTATGSTTFSATVNGTSSPSQAVNWSTTAGTINSSGVFTAPAQIGSIQTITVTATSVQDGSKSGAATVTIAAVGMEPTVSSVSVSPGFATGSATFTAIVNGSNSPSQSVTWEASAGSISSTGVFTAPAQTSSVQTITITARSVLDTSKTGTATVSIAALAPVVQRTVSLAMLNAASLGSLKWAWFDQPLPNNFAAPTDKGAAESTDANGVLTITLSNSQLQAGGVGWLVVTNSDGTPGAAQSAFCGPCVVA